MAHFRQLVRSFASMFVDHRDDRRRRCHGRSASRYYRRSIKSPAWLARGPTSNTGRAAGHGAVDFTGMDDAHHVIAHADHVDVGGGQRLPQVFPRLIRQEPDVGSGVLFDEAAPTLRRARPPPTKRNTTSSRWRSCSAARSTVCSGWAIDMLPLYITTNLSSKPCSRRKGLSAGRPAGRSLPAAKAG